MKSIDLHIWAGSAYTSSFLNNWLEFVLTAYVDEQHEIIQAEKCIPTPVHSPGSRTVSLQIVKTKNGINFIALER